jgi:hypothetical protein
VWESIFKIRCRLIASIHKEEGRVDSFPMARAIVIIVLLNRSAILFDS